MITFRPPTMQDLPVMFAWQQHPRTKENSPGHRYPSWEAYKETVEAASRDTSKMLELMCLDGLPVGFVVFFDRGEDVGLGIRIAPGMEGRNLEQAAVDYAKERMGHRLIVHIDTSAIKDQQAFSDMGFVRRGTTDIWEYKG